MKRIWGIFTLYLIVFVLTVGGNLRFADDATSSMWFVIMVFAFVLSIVLLVKNRFPDKKRIIISAVFGLLMFAPSLVMTGGTFSLQILPIPLVTFLSSVAFFSISAKYPESAIALLKGKTARDVAVTVGLGLGVGIIWGIINIFLNNEQPSLQMAPAHFIVPLNPGIYEEMVFKALIFASCLHCFKGELATKWRRFTAWFMMIIPHVLPHTPDMFIQNGLISGLFAVVILTLVFGLPFAVLQRKRDLASAMIAHGVVMIIFFNVFGINMS